MLEQLLCFDNLVLLSQVSATFHVRIV